MAEVILIAGPTASGKSALALAIARARGGVVVNADSMQVYRDLRILTARPSLEEEAAVPHRLYGHVDGAQNYSVGRWLQDCAALLAEFENQPAHQRPIVIVGGTGLYFKALTQGMSDIPDIADEARMRARALAEGRTSADLHALLAARAPEDAARLRPSDTQRILRALEVFEATGRSLTSFHSARAAPLLAPGAWRGFFLAPDRNALRAMIDRRFEHMVAAGALKEVETLAGRRLDGALPIMRAHGAPHLLAHLRGQLSLSQAIARGQADTRAYVKRQFTFMRHQLSEFQQLSPEAARAAFGV